MGIRGYLTVERFLYSLPVFGTMDIDERISLIKQTGEEIITESDLRALLETKTHPLAYDGFEPSGSMHIAQGLLRAITANKLIRAGCTFTFWVADWFAWANNKLEGDLEKIQTCGKYFIEIWRACGMDLDKVEFLWSKDVMNDDEYWKKVMNIARHNTLKRILRCSQIMGRSESDSLYASQIFYPCMQAADVFHLKADITSLGMDQRKVNMLVREIGPKLGFWKPVVINNHMLMGLGVPSSNAKSAAERAIDMKMSKSKPETAVFMTDSELDIRQKIGKAYCPAKQVDENPLMEYSKYLIFERFDNMVIKRSEKFGGDLQLENYPALAAKYRAGDIHPLDLKNAVAEYINAMIEPVRTHFEKNKVARDLLKQVQGFQVTR